MQQRFQSVRLRLELLTIVCFAGLYNSGPTVCFKGKQKVISKIDLVLQAWS